MVALFVTPSVFFLALIQLVLRKKLVIRTNGPPFQGTAELSSPLFDIGKIPPR
jgi:hypothetical protein